MINSTVRFSGIYNDNWKNKQSFPRVTSLQLWECLLFSTLQVSLVELVLINGDFVVYNILEYMYKSNKEMTWHIYQLPSMIFKFLIEFINLFCAVNPDSGLCTIKYRVFFVCHSLVLNIHIYIIYEPQVFR